MLLGKHHFADVSTSTKMATLDSAMELMEKLRTASLEPAKKELADLQKFAGDMGFTGELQPWDVSFYAERQREALYAYTDEEIRPYFSLPKVLDGLFQLAKRLFDVEVVPADVKPALWDPGALSPSECPAPFCADGGEGDGTRQALGLGLMRACARVCIFLARSLACSLSCSPLALSLSVV